MKRGIDMFVIRNKTDLQIAYWMLRDYQGKHENSQMKEYLATMNAEQKKKVQRKIKALKTEIRRYHRDYPVSENVLVRDYGIDGYIVRFPLPDWIEDKEDGRVWFMENEYIHSRPSYYDCTGQAFTSWFKVYKHSDGRWWAYHRVSFDV